MHILLYTKKDFQQVKYKYTTGSMITMRGQTIILGLKDIV